MGVHQPWHPYAETDENCISRGVQGFLGEIYLIPYRNQNAWAYAKNQDLGLAQSRTPPPHLTFYQVRGGVKIEKRENFLQCPN